MNSCDDWLKWFNEREKEVGFYGACEENICRRNPQHGNILVQAVRLCSVPTRFDNDLVRRLFRSKLLGVCNRALQDRLLGEILHQCFTHRSPDGVTQFGETAREYFDSKLRQDVDVYQRVNRLIADYFGEKRRLLLASGVSADHRQISELRWRETFHLIAADGERGIRALKRLVKTSIENSVSGWREDFGDVKWAPSASLWAALNICKSRSEFIPMRYQGDVDSFRDQYLAVGGKFNRIIVGQVGQKS